MDESVDLNFQEKHLTYSINKALEQLSPNESLALRLFYLEEESVKDVSEITGWSEENVKVILHRGRKKHVIHPKPANEKRTMMTPKDKTTFDDNNFSELMKKARLKMPGDLFEEELMRKIEAATASYSSRNIYKTFSIFFFILSTILGVFITWLLHKNEPIISDIPPGTLSLSFQILFVILFLFQLEKYIKEITTLNKITKIKTA